MTNMLAAFPELIRAYTVFKMKPCTGAGYGEHYDEWQVRGYWSWRKQSKMDIEGGLRTPNHQATFWVQWGSATLPYLPPEKDAEPDRKPIELGDYVEVDGKVFVAVDEQDFSLEGGFSKMLMQRLAGVTDKQVANKKVDEAIANDY